nr:hypothetical protein CFP56_60681 [Quercus suber]
MINGSLHHYGQIPRPMMPAFWSSESLVERQGNVATEQRRRAFTTYINVSVQAISCAAMMLGGDKGIRMFHLTTQRTWDLHVKSDCCDDRRSTDSETKAYGFRIPSDRQVTGNCPVSLACWRIHSTGVNRVSWPCVYVLMPAVHVALNNEYSRPGQESITSTVSSVTQRIAVLKVTPQILSRAWRLGVGKVALRNKSSVDCGPFILTHKSHTDGVSNRDC